MKNFVQAFALVVALVFIFAGCGMMISALSEETSAENMAVVLAAAGSGFAVSGLLLYSITSSGDLKEVIEAQNKILLEINRSIQESRSTSIEIARRQYQVEKRDIQSLPERNKSE